MRPRCSSVRRGVLSAAVALMLAGCGPAAGGAVDGPVTIYVSLPLTGPRAADGEDAADGARLALDQAGGRAGELEVRARFLDDARGSAWDPVAVGENARRATQDSTAVAYIGELDSEPTRASVPITNDAGIVQVSPGAGGVDLTRPATGYPDTPDRYQPSGDPSFARVIPADDVQAHAAAEWASELGARRAAAVSDGSPFANLTADEFSTEAEELGIEITSDQAQVDVVFDAASLGLTVLRPSLQRLATEAALDPETLPGKEFPGQFRARFGREPDPYAAYGYEAMSLALAAVDAADQGSGEFRSDVRRQVLSADRTDSVLGPYSISSEGDTTACMIQRYRLGPGGPEPLGAPCPPR